MRPLNWVVLIGGNGNFVNGKRKFIFQKKKKICGLSRKNFFYNILLLLLRESGERKTGRI